MTVTVGYLHFLTRNFQTKNLYFKTHNFLSKTYSNMEFMDTDFGLPHCDRQLIKKLTPAE